jgi:alpha-1,2-mannosyltransferase
MSLMSRIRLVDRKAVPDFTGRPRVRVPGWLLLPGLIALFVSTALLVLVHHTYHYAGSDLNMYRSSALALRNGEQLYARFFDGLPFTSPPITAIFMRPTTYVTLEHANEAMLVIAVVATVVAMMFASRMLGHVGLAGRLGVASAVAAVAFWTEPFQTTFLDGQLNVLLLLLILGDMAQSDKSRFKGIGIGVAAALKLIPALFVVYLILTRRFRAAAMAVGTFVVLTAIGWVVAPSDSVTFWFKGGLDSRKVLIDPRFWGEQALQGTVARLLDSSEQGSVAWLLTAAVVGVAGLALAVWAQRRGFEGIGVVTTAFVALLISPTSWSHYWVWVAPLTMVIGDVAVRYGGRTRTLAAGLAAIAIVPYLSWPTNPPVLGPKGPVGLIWTIKWSSSLERALFLDAYTITILILFVIAAVWLYLSRPVPAAAEATETAAQAPLILAGQPVGKRD